MDVMAQSVCLRYSLPGPVLDGFPAVRIAHSDVDTTMTRRRPGHTEEALSDASAEMLF